MNESAPQPHPAHVSCGKRLNSEAGNQRVKRRVGFRTSSRPESYRTIAFKNRGRDNIERYRRDQGINSVIGAVLQQSQDAVANLTGTGFRSRENTARAVCGSMLAHCAVTLSHDGHVARRRHLRHALASRHTKLTRHLPDYQQEQEHRQCSFMPH